MTTVALRMSRVLASENVTVKTTVATATSAKMSTVAGRLSRLGVAPGPGEDTTCDLEINSELDGLYIYLCVHVKRSSCTSIWL